MMKKGIVFIMIATLSFAIMNTLAKVLSDFHPMQVVFFRAFGSAIFIWPFMVYRKISFIGNNPKFLFLRGFLGVTSLATFFIVIQRIPLGSAISIRYLGPLFGAALAYYFLREKINIKQILSFAIAFSGVIVLKGFDVRIDNLSLILIIISAVLVGGIFVLLRYLGNKEHFLTIINYFMTMAILCSLFFISEFRLPNSIEWISVVGIGITGLIGQIFMTKAFQLEEASVLAPFKYMELIYALIIGLYWFDETYTVLAFLGIIMILAGMMMNLYFKDKPVKT